MGRTAGILLALVVGVAASSPVRGEPFARGRVGGGYDSNLNAASTSSAALGSGFGFVSAAVGVATEPARVRYQLLARWTGNWYVDYDDLSSNRVSAAAASYVRLADRWVLSIEPRLGGSFYGDSDRDAFEAAGRIVLRWQVHERVALLPEYELRYEDARASEFDETANRFGLGLDTRLWRGGWLGLGTAVEVGQVPRYLDVPVGSLPPGGGGPSGGATQAARLIGTFGRPQWVVRVDSTLTEVTMNLEQGLGRRGWILIEGGYDHVSADPAPYDVFFVSASLGVRLP